MGRSGAGSRCAGVDEMVYENNGNNASFRECNQSHFQFNALFTNYLPGSYWSTNIMCNYIWFNKNKSMPSRFRKSTDHNNILERCYHGSNSFRDSASKEKDLRRDVAQQQKAISASGLGCDFLPCRVIVGFNFSGHTFLLHLVDCTG